MRETLSAPLSELEGLSHALLLSLSPYTTKPQAPPPTSALLECDASIAAALHQARQHQIRQRRIEALKKDVLDLEGKLREVYSELEMGRRELGEILEKGAGRQEEIARAAEGMHLLVLVMPLY
jgi:mediator of RNA polymerase II transcription subunit 4